jgi:HAMP domain-containing protein
MSPVFYAAGTLVVLGLAVVGVMEVRKARVEVRRLRNLVRSYRRIDAVEREAVRLMQRIGRRE